MATTTIWGHVARALDFFERNDIYFAIGKSSPWPDDSNPPVPQVNEEMQEIIGFKKVENIYMVVPDDNGTISYRDSRWRIVPADEALENGARWVYIDTYIRYTELPIVPYRQIGVFSRLIPKEGIPAGKLNLLPEEVEDKGIMEILDNRKPVNRDIDQRELLSLIIEF